MRHEIVKCSLMLLAVSLQAIGCGGNEGPPISAVSGNVMLDGKPLTAGSINFQSDAGFGVSANLDTSGHYTFLSQHGAGIPLGSYKVSISPPPAKIDPNLPAGGVAETPPGAESFPPKYSNMTTSGFTAEVKSGENKFDFDMDSK